MTSRRRFKGEGLGISSPLRGCHYWQSCSVSVCCLRGTVLDSSGLRFRIVRLLGLTADTVHLSVFGGFLVQSHFFKVKVDLGS